MVANFVKISSCRINLDNVVCVDYHTNLIHFIGGYSLSIEPECMQDFKKIIDKQVKHGKWKFVNQATNFFEPPNGDTCKCSECGYEIDVSETIYRYCPMCGTNMKEGTD